MFNYDKRAHLKLAASLVGVGLAGHAMLERWLRQARSTPRETTIPDESAEREPAVHQGRPRQIWAHRVISSLVALAWIPLGLVVFYLAAYCSTDGRRVTEIVVPWVVFQVLANAAAGWVLDTRARTSSGLLLALGRSGLVAVLLVVVTIPWLAMSPAPRGNCG